jgi:peptide/nickel transport system substrate-binding protein
LAKNLRRLVLGLVAVLLLLAFLVGFAAPTAGLAQVRAQTPSLIALPRSETVYMGGAIWGPITSLNPFSPSNSQLDDYLQSMVYLPLFLFSPVTGSLYPALGENFTVTSVTVPASLVYGPNATGTVDRAALEIWIWPNATWQDGYPVTADDVVFTLYLAKYFTGLSWSWMFSGGPGSILNITPVTEKEVMIIFNSSPSSPPWGTILSILTGYSYDAVPLHEFYPNLSAFFANPTKWNPLSWSPNVTQIIGDGPYRVYAYTPSEIVFIRWDNWWGWNIWGVPANGMYAPEYVAGLVITSNPQAISMFETYELDWGSYFLTNVWQLQSYNVYTYFTHPPWNLQYGPSVVLLINNEYPPYNITLVRRAIAYAINTSQLAAVGENGQELPCNISNGFGLLSPYNLYYGAWGKYINMSIIQRYGWTFNLTEAQLLMQQVASEYGWHKNSQGYWVMPNGAVVNATIIVPYGWTDWMEDAELIAQNLSKIGIEASTVFPTYSEYWTDVSEGEFSMALMWGWTGPLPATWFQYYVYTYGAAPIGSWAWADLERFTGPAATEATQAINTIFSTNPYNLTAVMPYYDELETVFFNYTPVVPLLLGAYWYEYSTTYWAGWPNETTGTIFPPANWAAPYEAYILVHLHPKGVTVTTTTPKPITVTYTTATTTTTTTTTTATTTTTTTSVSTTTVTSVTTVVSSAVSTLTTTVTKLVTSTTYLAIAVVVTAIVVGLVVWAVMRR